MYQNFIFIVWWHYFKSQNLSGPIITRYLFLDNEGGEAKYCQRKLSYNLFWNLQIERRISKWAQVTFFGKICKFFFRRSISMIPKSFLTWSQCSSFRVFQILECLKKSTYWLHCQRNPTLNVLRNRCNAAAFINETWS